MITLATILCLAITEAVPAFRPAFQRKPIDDIVARCGKYPTGFGVELPVMGSVERR